MKIFMVKFAVEIPVTAESSDAAREYLLHNKEVVDESVTAALNNESEDDSCFDFVNEVTLDYLDENPGCAELVPWGDEGWETIDERLSEEVEYSSDDDELAYDCD